MKLGRLALALPVALLAAACTVTTSDPVPTYDPTFPGPGSSVTNGTLRVDWTINGSADPSACNQSGVSVIEVMISTGAGTVPAVYQQDCRAFATSITLAPGTYSATAQLLDGASQPRTTSVDLQPFAIRPNEELRIPVDFPFRSFF